MFDLNFDGHIILLTRFIRLFSYGFLAVGLVLYLNDLGYSQTQVGYLFTFTLIGDIVITFFLTTTADSFGRKKVLIVGALLKVFAGVIFAFVNDWYWLLTAGVVGIISPTGGEIGPFLAIEQAALTDSLIVNKESSKKAAIAKLFAYYNLIGYAAQAGGALCGGWLIFHLQHRYSPFSPIDSYRSILIGYSLFGALKFFLYLSLSEHIEAPLRRDLSSTLTSNSLFGRFGLHRPSSVVIVAKLSALFVIDAFAGGFVMQTIISYYFHERYQMDIKYLGVLLMGANILSGLSAIVATPLVEKIGAINTMVFTHFPSNIFLLLVPLMPTELWAVIMLLLRFSIAQMDVPARQMYVATVVEDDERSAAGGITNIVRSLGVAISPIFVGVLIEDPKNTFMFGLPFIIAGGLKCVYDVALYCAFRMSQDDREEYEPISEERRDGEKA